MKISSEALKSSVKISEAVERIHKNPNHSKLAYTAPKTLEAQEDSSGFTKAAMLAGLLGLLGSWCRHWWLDDPVATRVPRTCRLVVHGAT